MRAAAVVGAVLLAAAPVLAQTSAFAPGELFVGSRRYGSIYAPFAPPPPVGPVRGLVTGTDLLTFDLRGGGPAIECPGGHLSLLAVDNGRLLARPGVWSIYGVYDVNTSNGNRTLVPGTDGPTWASTSDMLRWDADTILVVADDFQGGQAGPHMDDAKILRRTMSTGATTIVSGTTVGNGPVMHRPRSIARLDADHVLVSEVGPISGSSLFNAFLFKVNTVTGARTIVSSLINDQSNRRSVVGGVVLPPAPTALVGTGPTFDEGIRGLAVHGGRVFAGGAVRQPNGDYLGGLIEIDPVTGDRTLLVGSARTLTGTIVTVAAPVGSDSFLPTSPTALIPYSHRSIAFCSTWGPSRIWVYDVVHGTVNDLIDLASREDPGVSPPGPINSGLTQAPYDCAGSTIQITSQPVGGAGCSGSSITLHAPAISTGPGPLTYFWLIADSSTGPWQVLQNGSNLPPGGGGPIAVSGAKSAQLTLVAGTQAAPLYLRAEISNLCQTVFSNAVTVTPPCIADFTCDGSRTVDDIFVYINAWFAGDPRADVNGVSGLNVDDIFVFINLWFVGC